MIVIANGSVRRVLRILLPAVLMPLTVLVGVLLEERGYAAVAVVLVLEALLFFITGFEEKRIGGRRLVIVSVMVALSVVGRFIPLFKPITALTIIAAVHLGAEAGFLVGAMSAFLSNFYFVQGPWTPFQMLAWGGIGLIAGALAPKLRESRPLVMLYGCAAGILYSGIMDVWSVLWYSGTLTPSLYLASVVTALPHTLVYTVSNLLFLGFFTKPFGEKLTRIKKKYGV